MPVSTAAVVAVEPVVPVPVRKTPLPKEEIEKLLLRYKDAAPFVLLMFFLFILIITAVSRRRRSSPRL